MPTVWPVHRIRSMNDTTYTEWLTATLTEWMHDDETERLERIADLAVRVDLRMEYEHPSRPEWAHESI